ncbi:kinesin-like protein KIF25 [Halichondria panicea]|uniref:kinesin-like protein KIF25 n=1 Tax=Halichondria panicea TaxID=6063 RepID=UPI00312B4DDE
MDLMLRTKVSTREKEERIAVLETENAILHLQIAQLQNSFKAQLRRQDASFSSYKLHQLKISQLLDQVQQLKQNLRDLQSEYVTYQEEWHKMTSTVLPDILHKHSCKLTEFRAVQRKYEEERTKRKELHNELIELRGNIRVHCRVRPLLQTDIDKECTCCIDCIDDETVSVEYLQTSYLGSKISKKLFCFDRVYGPNDAQETVFADVKPLLTSLVDGYNVCVMAYGQTGSGKTYTMLGGCEQSAGVLPLAATELFRLVEGRLIDCEITATVVEIYNEQIIDLLSPKREVSQHNVLLDRNGDVEVTNITERLVSSESELLSVVSEGMQRRATHSTHVHEHSSRSHLIVTIHITARGEGGVSIASSVSSLQLNTTITPVSSTDSTPLMSPTGSPPKLRYSRSHLSKSSNQLSFSGLSTGSNKSTSPRHSSLFHVKLQLVDLAGSECVGQSGVHGTQLKEAQHINKSLCALSNVLGALAEKRSHIPYRNSTLTHVLQDSIGGNAKMVMFLCLSPTRQQVVESLRVLGFGARARQVQRPPPTAKRTPRVQNA